MKCSISENNKSCEYDAEFGDLCRRHCIIYFDTKSYPVKNFYLNYNCEVRELKKNIGQIKSIEKKEEKEEKKAAKFNEQSLEEKIEKIKQHRQYNPPKEEIQGPKVEKPEPQPEPKPEPKPEPVPAPAPAPAPVAPARPKYFMPTMKYVTKHKWNNPL